MYDRRDFFKTTTAAAASILVAGAVIPACATKDVMSYTNIVYTKDNPGKWEKKVGSHAPRITVNGGKVTVSTNHPMSNEHFIVRHTLVLRDGTFLGGTTFTPSDKPESHYDLPAGYKGKIFATSFCNKHDFWLTEAMI